MSSFIKSTAFALIAVLSAGAVFAASHEVPVLSFVGPDRTLEFASADIALAEAAYRPEAAAVQVCLKEPAARRLRSYMGTILNQQAELRIRDELLASLIVYEVQRDPCAWYAVADIDEAERLARKVYSGR